MEPIVTRQTSWLESTGVCGVRQTKLVGVLLGEEPKFPVMKLTSALVSMKPRLCTWVHDGCFPTAACWQPITT